jgi:hypothetical protein
MKYYSFNWPVKFHYIDLKKARHTAQEGVQLLVGIEDEVAASVGDKQDILGVVRPVLPFFEKYVGPGVAKSLAGDYDSIGHFIYANGETVGQAKLIKVIDSALEELGSIRVSSVVAWHHIHDNDKDADVPLRRLRIEAKEENKIRVLNLVGSAEDQLIVDDPFELAAAITDLF